MICNMAAIGHLELSKFRGDATWPLSPCYSASLCKMSLKSYNQLLSYGHLTVMEYQICIVYQISSKSDDFSLTYGNLMIFKMAALCHLEF